MSLREMHDALGNDGKVSSDMLIIAALPFHFPFS